MSMYRQGDILLIAEVIPAPQGNWQKRVPVPDGIIAHGEATGHAHRVEDGQLVEQAGARYVVAGPEGTRIVHDEHETIVLPEGTYRVVRQREYEGEGHYRVVSD